MSSCMHAKFLEKAACPGQWKATSDALDQVKWSRLNALSETKH